MNEHLLSQGKASELSPKPTSSEVEAEGIATRPSVQTLIHSLEHVQSTSKERNVMPPRHDPGGPGIDLSLPQMGIQSPMELGPASPSENSYRSFGKSGQKKGSTVKLR